MLTKRTTIDELRRAIKNIDRIQGFDHYNCQACLFTRCNFSNLRQFLHLLNICLEIDFRPLKQVSVTHLLKPGKTASTSSNNRCISLASHAGELLGRMRVDQIRSLDFLSTRGEEQYSSGKSRSAMKYIYQMIFDLEKN